MIHDDVMKWKYFPRYFVSGIYRSPVVSPHKDQWRGVWIFLWSAPEQTVAETIERRMIWDAIALIMTYLWCNRDISIIMNGGERLGANKNIYPRTSRVMAPLPVPGPDRNGPNNYTIWFVYVHLAKLWNLYFEQKFTWIKHRYTHSAWKWMSWKGG